MVKVKILWGGHKVWKNIDIYSVTSKQMGDLFQIFVAFSDIWHKILKNKNIKTLIQIGSRFVS